MIVDDKCLYKKYISSVAKYTAQSMLFFAVFILLTLTLSLRHINHLSANAGILFDGMEPIHTSQPLFGHD